MITNFLWIISSIQIWTVIFRTVWHNIRKPNLWCFPKNQQKNFDNSITIGYIKHEIASLQLIWARDKNSCPKTLNYPKILQCDIYGSPFFLNLYNLVMVLDYNKRPRFYLSWLTQDCVRTFTGSLSLIFFCIIGLLHRNIKMSHCTNLAYLKRYLGLLPW